ncbi:hypothetical protein [Thalassotalea sp. PS06]|uniref:hypothetical protein n=1 Tax=Thalassotalea sp. PS06 TaxID=2594005 RepID=UPI001162182E|nr:hypothetical protein [Thalassotalea sp. PS06]QDP01029.1 hypothetical protein FNC98_06520 [Thalassotalea sp. PS06]
MAGVGLFSLLIVFIIWLLPIVFIATSSKTRAGEKVIWLILVVFVSWLAWLLYWLLAPLHTSDLKQS